MTSLSTVPGPVKLRILSTLESGRSLSTADFTDLGYSFEMFLRYGQLSGANIVKAHNALHRQLSC